MRPFLPDPITDSDRSNARRCIRNGVLLVIAGVAAGLLLPIAGCTSGRDVTLPKNARHVVIPMTVTGYDSGPVSCGWRRNCWGTPVYAYGPMKGKRKEVGITASGVEASIGTVAADTTSYPFGTILYIPGYGYGVVEDRGGAIKGPYRLDLWFPSRGEALDWGRRSLNVHVWLPLRSPVPEKARKP